MFVIVQITVFKFSSRTTTIEPGTTTYKVFPSVGHSERYCVVYNYWEAAEEYAEGPHITLVLHATYNYLIHLEDQLRTWEGGISVAVFVPTPLDQTMDPVEILDSQVQLKLFFSALSSPRAMKIKNTGKVSLHIFFKKKKFDTCPKLVIPENSYSIFKISLSDIKRLDDITDVYPINAARNIARRGSRTKLFISGDIEQVYVKHFESKMYQLAKKVLLEFVRIILFFIIQHFREKRKTVLVYRRFELKDEAPMPQNKEELRQLMVSRQAVEFHKYYNGAGHHIRKIWKWLKTPEDGKTINITDEITYNNRKWEPQFVGDDRVPFHDERFPYRFKTNIHLVSLNKSFVNKFINSGPSPLLQRVYFLSGFRCVFYPSRHYEKKFSASRFDSISSDGKESLCSLGRVQKRVERNLSREGFCLFRVSG